MVVCGCLAAAVVPKAAALALVLVERLAIGALIGLENGLARVAAIAGALGAAVLVAYGAYVFLFRGGTRG